MFHAYKQKEKSNNEKIKQLNQESIRTLKYLGIFQVDTIRD